MGEQFKLRRRQLDCRTGNFVYASIQFPISIQNLHLRLKEGQKYHVNLDCARICFKRPKHKQNDNSAADVLGLREDLKRGRVVENEDGCDNDDDNHDDEADDSNTITVFKNALEIVKSNGRGSDFMSVLMALADGTLDPKNIALHLLLDIGSILSEKSLSSVRYNKTTMDFWTLVYRMFKGKATRFFRGSMSADLDSSTGIVINFITTLLTLG